MTKRIIAILSLAIMAISQAYSQDDSTALWKAETDIARAMEKCLQATDDAKRTAYAGEAANLMEDILKNPMAFQYDFPHLKKSMSIIKSQNGLVKAITFGTALMSGKYIYHGFIMCQTDDDGDEITVTRLRQGRRPESDPENANMQANNWYGAIYYEISQFGKKSNPIYALCGWDGADQYTNCKVLEQLTFDDEGHPVLGGLFETEKGNGYSRVIFRFGERVVMSLQYNDKEKMIIGDHLSAPPEYNGTTNPKFMGPDLSFDGYFYKDGRWHYEADLDVKIKGTLRDIKPRQSNNMLAPTHL